MAGIRILDVGPIVGLTDGDTVSPRRDGNNVGVILGMSDGDAEVGAILILGLVDGVDGAIVGTLDGDTVSPRRDGARDGLIVGLTDGVCVE